MFERGRVVARGLPLEVFGVPVTTGVARLTGGTPAVPLTAVRMARKRMYFSAEKAMRELGLPRTPAERALGDAVEWFVARGYAAPPQGRRAA